VSKLKGAIIFFQIKQIFELSGKIQKTITVFLFWVILENDFSV